ncbi:unnamed protein product [Amoebophrya sp. A120]|nr:unnamed protein product [Amoebophrya sp. A120]|eukprot:GSA120T00011369001.1
MVGPANIPGRSGVPAPPADLAPSGHSIEDQIRFHYFSPAPNTYNPNLPPKKQQLDNGLIKDGKHPSFTDLSGADIPGPGQYSAFVYEPGDMPMPQGGRVYQKDRTKVMQGKGLIGPKHAARMLKEYAGAKFPDPGTYFPDVTNVRPRLAKLDKFGKQPKFPRPFRSTMDGPGVGKYDVMSAQEFLDPFVPEGGKNWLNQHKPQHGYFDEATFVTQANPGPGAYTPQMLPARRDFAQEAFHHTTETMEESKALVKKHTSSDAPGPGQYSLPELPSLSQAPKIVGRTLPYAVPKPFSYNAQPDMARKFQPLRSSNSGDLIYGRSFKSGQQMLQNYPSHSSSTRNGAPDGPPAIGTYSQRQLADQAKKKQKDMENEQIAMDEHRIARKEKELSEKPGQNKWVEGGFEMFDLEPMFDTNGQPIKKKAEPSHSPTAKSPNRVDFLTAKPADIADEHPAVLRAAQNYQQMAGKIYKPIKGFLPGAAKRPVAIDPSDDSNMTLSFDVGRKEYIGITKALRDATEDLIQHMKAELPMEHLLHHSENSLRNKALRKMNLDGIRPAVSRKVLAEMPRLFEKPTDTRARLEAEAHELQALANAPVVVEIPGMNAPERPDSSERPADSPQAEDAQPHEPAAADALASTDQVEASVREGAHEQLGQTTSLTVSQRPEGSSMVLNADSIEAGAAVAGPTEHIDIFPTQEGSLDGPSLQSTMREETQSAMQSTVLEGAQPSTLLETLPEEQEVAAGEQATPAAEGGEAAAPGAEAEAPAGEQEEAAAAGEAAAEQTEGVHEGEDTAGGAAEGEADPAAPATEEAAPPAEEPESAAPVDAEEKAGGAGDAEQTEGDHASIERDNTAEATPAPDETAAPAPGDENRPDTAQTENAEGAAPTGEDEPAAEAEVSPPPEEQPAEESKEAAAAPRPAVDVDAEAEIAAEPSPGGTELSLAEADDHVGPLASEVATGQSLLDQSVLDAELPKPPEPAPDMEAEHTIAPMAGADGEDFDVD